jgi:DNA polymerase
MVIGEALGKDEVKQGLTFCGPAGKVLDKIWETVGWDTNTDWILCNTCSCRPIAEPGSGRENLAPDDTHKAACRPLLDRLITLVKPRIIVLVGGTAAINFFPELKGIPVSKIVGTVRHHPGYDMPFFICYHPSYVLRQQHMKNYPELRQTIIKHMEDLKNLTIELESE